MTAIKVFISYKTSPVNSGRAAALAQLLRQHPLDVFLDQEGMAGGVKWPDMIYNNIIDSDSLLVLLTEDVMESEWVRREVDLARGAKIDVIPVLVADKDAAGDVLSTLGIPDLHYISYLTQSPDELNKLIRSIKNSADRTWENQKKWINRVQERHKERQQNHTRNKPALTRVSRRAYRYRRHTDTHPVHIHLASGDIVSLKGIDALVNSENSYMQMARFFEGETVSGSIRGAGVKSKGVRFDGDNIQEELNAQVKAHWAGGKVPVDISEVFVTTSGTPQGKLLNENNCRYIFHVATLAPIVTASGLRLQQLQDPGLIHDCVFNVLEKVVTINEQCGNIFINDDGDRYSDMDFQKQYDPATYEPIISIAFPLIGTGTGEADEKKAIKAILNGIKKFLDKYPAPRLQHIHIVPFLNRQKDAVQNQLDAEFELIKN